MFRIKFAAAFAALLAIVVGIPGITNSPSTANAAQSIPGAYIVVLKDGVDSNTEARRTEREHEDDRERGGKVRHVYHSAINGYSFTGSAAAAARIAKDPRVAFVSEDGVVEAVGGPVTATPVLAATGVRRIGANTTSNTGAGVGVAVIDTGIQIGHPGLPTAQNGKNCVGTGNAIDDNGHGTHVAGTIAGSNTGVAPGANLYAVKVLDATGSGTWSQVICGIEWVTANAAANNIKVASLSLGGRGFVSGTCTSTSDAMRKAICNATNAGVTFVVAAGNSGTGFGSFVPAAYPEVLTVTAMSDSDGKGGGTGGAPTCRTGESDDVPASFSNYASSTSDSNHTIAGPGVCIYSTWLGGGYNTISGTSMATPHVSGVVALCIASGKCTGAPSLVIQRLRTDAASKDSNNQYGFKRDPNSSPLRNKSYGYLAWAGGY